MPWPVEFNLHSACERQQAFMPKTVRRPRVVPEGILTAMAPVCRHMSEGRTTGVVTQGQDRWEGLCNSSSGSSSVRPEMRLRTKGWWR